MKILISGGTGFLGKFTTRELKKNHELALISRKAGFDVQADLTSWDAGMNIENIKGKYDLFLHMAGLYDLRATLEDSLLQNVSATHNALTICQKANIPHFVHISTVAVTAPATVDRNVDVAIDTSCKFPDFYSYSKAHAENLVRTWQTHLFKSKTIIRLGILVGDSIDGFIERIDGPYHTPEFLRKIQKRNYQGPLILPDSEYHRLPIVPVDAAAHAIAQIVSYIERNNTTGTNGLYLTPKRGLSASDLYRATLQHLNMKNNLLTTTLMPKQFAKFLGEKLLHIPQEELEYLLSLSTFDTTRAEDWAGKNWCPEFEIYENAFWSGYEKYISNR